MSRRKKQEVAPSIFRFMCIKTDGKNYTAEFQSKDEAIQYADSLYDTKMEWYGIYEINPKSDYLKAIVNKRIVPYNDLIPIDYVIQSSKKAIRKKKPVRKTKSKSV